MGCNWVNREITSQGASLLCPSREMEQSRPSPEPANQKQTAGRGVSLADHTPGGGFCRHNAVPMSRAAQPAVGAGKAAPTDQKERTRLAGARKPEATAGAPSTPGLFVTGSEASKPCLRGAFIKYFTEQKAHFKARSVPVTGRAAHRSLNFPLAICFSRWSRAN